jgi:hypothetical protein
MTDSSYKMYITAMTAVIKNFDPNIRDTTITGWMSDISIAIPYYKHTNPQVMAIGKYMLQSNPGKFDRELAKDLVRRTSFNYVGKKNTDSVVIDVARYWLRLSNFDTEEE